MIKNNQGNNVNQDNNNIVEEKRIIYVHGQIDEEMHFDIAKRVLSFDMKIKSPITVHINSPGGDVYEAMGILDILKGTDCPIYTVCTGKAMSAAVPILASGERGFRKAGALSTIMIHEVSLAHWGKLYEFKNEAAEAERLQAIMLELLSNYTGIQKSKLKKIFDTHVDTYISPIDAKKIGLIDEIF